MKTLTSKLIAGALLLSVAQQGFAGDEMHAAGKTAYEAAAKIAAGRQKSERNAAKEAARKTAQAEEQEKRHAAWEKANRPWYSNAWNATTGFASSMREKVTGAGQAAWNVLKPFEARDAKSVEAAWETPYWQDLYKVKNGDLTFNQKVVKAFAERIMMPASLFAADHPNWANAIYYPTMLALAAGVGFGTYKGIKALNNWRKLRNKSEVEKVKSLRDQANGYFAAQLENDKQSIKPLVDVCKELRITNELIIETAADFDKNFIAQDGTLIAPVKAEQQIGLAGFFDTLENFIVNYEDNMRHQFVTAQ